MNESARQENMEILVSDGAGQFLPKEFVSTIEHREWDISEEDYATLIAGPDDEWYWDAWNDVLEYASYEDDFGHIWKLYHKGDLWAIREGFDPEEENEDDGLSYREGDEDIEAPEFEYLDQDTY